jgi:hypothetical protein
VIALRDREQAADIWHHDTIELKKCERGRGRELRMIPLPRRRESVGEKLRDRQ